MSIAVYVIDTSYLLELFQVPDHSNPSSITEIKERLKNAIINKSRLYVPLPCIFELGNRIAKVNNGSERHKLANTLYEAIKLSIETNKPWIIIPSASINELQLFCKKFAEQYVINGIGLTDTTVISETIRLKKKYRKLGYTVHIWTKDRSLKAHEPDTEEDPFLRVD